MTRDTTSVPVQPPSPEAVARLVNLAEDAIISVNDQHRIVLFNRGAERTFGYQIAEVLGRPLEILFPRRFAVAHEGHMRSFAAASADARLMGERRPVFGLRKDDTEFPAEVTISKFAENGRQYFNAIVRDMTERVRAEAEILALNRDLEDRVRARTAELEEANSQLAIRNEENETFVYSVSHDLRSPLVNLEGFSQELATSYEELKQILTDPSVPAEIRTRAERVLDDSVRESLGFIRSSVTRLSGIIDALLRLSRAGRVQYEPRKVDLGPVVSRVVQALRATADRKGAAVTVGDLPPVWADPIATEQVFANLIGNALNYLSPSRSGQVEVGAIGDEEAERTFYVRDNGVGIPLGHQTQLFLAFRRLHEHLAPGEGMGLLIVRRILDRLGGRIWFQSVEGAGTTFFFTLPGISGTSLK